MLKLRSFGSLAAALVAGAAVTAADRGRHVELAPPEVRRDSVSESVRASKAFELIRTSTALGEQVRSAAGEHLGEIQELVIDTSRQRVGFAVLDCGEVPDHDGRFFAVPWRAMSYDLDPKVPQNERMFTLNVDKQRLEEAPGFDVTAWPDMADQSWARDVHTFYGQEPYWERKGGTGLRGEPISPGRGRPARSSKDRPAKPHMLKVKAEMARHPVQHATNGETLGELGDLLIDPRTGDVAFVVVKLSPRSSAMRTQREKNFVALPTRMFAFARYGNPDAPYVIECCLENLKSHRFSAANWPDLKSRAWAHGLYLDFGRAPYWEQQ